MLLESKKIKTISQCYNISEDLVKSILDTYMALTLYNIMAYKEDESIVGNIQMDFENKMLKIISNSEYTDNIFNNTVDTDIFKRLLEFGKTKI